MVVYDRALHVVTAREFEVVAAGQQPSSARPRTAASLQRVGMVRWRIEMQTCGLFTQARPRFQAPGIEPNMVQQQQQQHTAAGAFRV